MTSLPEHGPHSLRLDTAQPLLRTVGGARLHIAPCPHILGADVSVATAADRLAMTVCSWCQKELDGVGRRYFQTRDDAMRFFGTHVGTEGLVREALRFVDHDEVWVPNSGSYIALGREGAGVAWVGKTYVVARRGAFVELPGNEPGAGGGGSAHEERRAGTCPGPPPRAAAQRRLRRLRLTPPRPDAGMNDVRRRARGSTTRGMP